MLLNSVLLTAFTACGTTTTATTATSARVATRTAVTAHPAPTVRVAVRIDKTPDPGRDAGFVDRDDQQPVATIIAERQQLIEAMPKVGSPAPDFTLSTLSGGSVTLSQLRGHPLIINFWASWCVPCRAEAPELQSAYEQFHAQGLVVLGVNDAVSDSRDNAAKFVAEFHLGYPIPLDNDGKVSDAYHVPGIPTTFFVDAHGVIRQVIMGQLSPTDLQQSIAMIMN